MAVFCHQCGSGLPPTARFCSSCGTGIPFAPAAQPMPGRPLVRPRVGRADCRSLHWPVAGLWLGCCCRPRRHCARLLLLRRVCRHRLSRRLDRHSRGTVPAARRLSSRHLSARTILPAPTLPPQERILPVYEQYFFSQWRKARLHRYRRRDRRSSFFIPRRWITTIGVRSSSRSRASAPSFPTFAATAL